MVLCYTIRVAKSGELLNEGEPDEIVDERSTFAFVTFSDEAYRYVDLSSLKISNCVGCFGCWVKTPGKCVIRG